MNRGDRDRLDGGLTTLARGDELSRRTEDPTVGLVMVRRGDVDRARRKSALATPTTGIVTVVAATLRGARDGDTDRVGIAAPVAVRGTSKSRIRSWYISTMDADTSTFTSLGSVRNAAKMFCTQNAEWSVQTSWARRNKQKFITAAHTWIALGIMPLPVDVVASASDISVRL